MNWSKGYSARYYISVVDRKTWRDIRRIEITGGSIKRSPSGLRESADISCMNYRETGEQIVRVWMDTFQDGESSEHIPLFTGLATTPGRDITGNIVKNTLECYSILKMAQDVLLPRGWYAPAGADVRLIIRDLLKVTGARMTFADVPENSGTVLANAIIAESGENNLSMVDALLDTIGWRLKLSGMGEISVEPMPLDRKTGRYDISARFDSLAYDILEPSLRIDYDWYSCPNVCRAVLNDVWAVARDDSEDSPLSTVNRGREVWVEDTGGYLNDGETIAEYAERMLREYQQVATTISYDRRFDPAVSVSDLIRLHYPAQDISGIFYVTSQTVTLGYNARTSEEVVQV